MKKMLVGLDGSVREHDVLQAAVGLARRTSAKLVLFRGVGLPTAIPLEALALAPQDLSAMLESRARTDLEALATKIPKELIAAIRVATGSPWDAICRTAQEEEVDMIVIGSHGYGAIDRLIGTTAAKVINHADRSVLVVRAAERLALA